MLTFPKAVSNMKVSLKLSIITLVALGDAAVLEARQGDKLCSVPGPTYVNCREGPSRSYPVARRVQPDQSFGVRCIRDGESIDGEKCVTAANFLGCLTEADR